MATATGLAQPLPIHDGEGAACGQDSLVFCDAATRYSERMTIVGRRKKDTP